MGAGATNAQGMANVSLRGQTAQKGVDPLKLLDQRTRLQEKAEDTQGTVTTRALARRQLTALDAQIKALATPKPGKQPFDENKNKPGVQAMPTAKPGQPKPATTPEIPDPNTPAPVTPAVPDTGPAPGSQADQAEALKLAEEERQRSLEKARSDELARRDAQRKKRGTGLESFITTGMRGLPTSLAQFLGI